MRLLRSKSNKIDAHFSNAINQNIQHEKNELKFIGTHRRAQTHTNARAHTFGKGVRTINNVMKLLTFPNIIISFKVTK